MRPPLAPVVGGAGSGPVAAAALAPVVAAVAGGIGGGSSIDNILQQNTEFSSASTVVAQWFKLLPIIHKVLGSIPVRYIFESD
jgi:hypothetical protein